MAVSHIYNQTVADGTATSVVRPSDWNSVHNQFMTLGGNTAGQSTVSGSNIILQGGNNITLSQVQGAGVATILFSGANTVAQTADTNKAGTGFTSTSTAGVLIVGTNNTNGLSLGVPNYLTTAQPVGAYLTTARASNDAIGLNTALTANGVSMTANSSGLSLNFPAFLTTGANSTHSHNFATTTTGGSNIVVGTANSVGATIGVPPFITTYVAQTNQTVASGNIAGVGTTFAGTNITATMGLNSNGLALSLSGGGGGVVNQTGPNIAVAGTTVTAGTVYFSNSPTVTFGMDGASNLTASAAGGAGGGVTMYDWQPFGMAASSNTSIGAQSVFFCLILPPNNVSFSAIEQVWSNSISSSAIAAWSKSMTFNYGIYAEGTGTNNTRIESKSTASVGLSVTGSSNVSIAFTYGAGATTTSFSSATSSHSLWNANKIMSLPIVGSMSGGGLYYFAQWMSTASAGANVAATFSQMINAEATNASFVGFGNSTINATNKSAVQEPYGFIYSATTNTSLPATVAYSDASIYSNYQPFLYFEG